MKHAGVLGSDANDGKWLYLHPHVCQHIVEVHGVSLESCPGWHSKVYSTTAANGEDNFNSLTPWKFDWNFIYAIFTRILVIDGWGITCEIA